MFSFGCLQGLGLKVVENVEEADFILAHGTEGMGLPSGDVRPMSLQDLEKILEICASKKIPMVVANPDYVTVEARALRVMPGKDILVNEIFFRPHNVAQEKYIISRMTDLILFDLKNFNLVSVDIIYSSHKLLSRNFSISKNFTFRNFIGLPFVYECVLIILGTLASKFEKLGGEVRWMGKPDKVVQLLCSLSSSVIILFLIFLDF